jgi:hypothetical protein
MPPLLFATVALESFELVPHRPRERTHRVESSALLPWIYGLMIGAVVCFIAGVITRFLRHKEGTLWYRGTLALLAFAMTFLLLAIYFQLQRLR